MAFSNPPAEALAALLRKARIIAIVGLSDNPRRPSYEIASALTDRGYRIVPVNPALAVWEGIRAVPDLDQVVQVLGPDEQVDIVDVFRDPGHVAGIVDDCVRLRMPALWLQLDVVDEAAAERAVAAGMTVVMDRCIKVERLRMD
jgi:predicted CoA-binding protein